MLSNPTSDAMNKDKRVVNIPDLTTNTDDFRSPINLSLSLTPAQVKENTWTNSVNPMAANRMSGSRTSQGFGDGSGL